MSRPGNPSLAILFGAAALLAWMGGRAPGPEAFSAPLPSDSPWEVGNGFRWKPAVPPPGSSAGFTAVPGTNSSGLRFTNRVSTVAALNNQILENGAGVALGDVDGDGACDVYLAGSEVPNALFRNLGGWRFDDVTVEAGVACPGQFSTGVALVDVDGDTDLDLLVNGLGVGTRLFRNDGRGRFREDNRAGLNRRHAATSLALADADGDGDLDLYVTSYRVLSARDEVPPPRIEVRRVGGRTVVTPANRFLVFPLADGNVEIAEKGEPDYFYLNDGHGVFREVGWTSGLFLDENGTALTEAPEEWGLSVLFRDLTGDGRPDLYVCNDYFRSRDRFWIQDPAGAFRAASPLAWRNMSLSSMAADAADIDRDGHLDLIVAEMLSLDHATRHRQRANAFRAEQALPLSDPSYQPELPRNTLFKARGDGSFAEIAQAAGVAASDWSWNVAFLDVDLDGFEDLLFATGNAHDVLDLDAQNALDRARRDARDSSPTLSHYPPLPQHPVAFRNRSDLTFAKASTAWRLDSTGAGVAQGMALGDLDGDGDLDVVMNRLNDTALTLRNDAPDPRVGIRLRGRAPNTAGVGATVRLLGGPVTQSQEIQSGGRYLSSDEALRTFAASPSSGGELRLEITWRDRRRTEIAGVRANRVYEIDEPQRSPTPTELLPDRPRDQVPVVKPLFTPLPSTLAHQDINPDPPDFRRQPLLPRALSHLGPGIAWIDWNEDGWDDLVIGAGPGRTPAFFTNVEGREFSARSSDRAKRDDAGTGETLGLVPWVRAGHPVALLASRAAGAADTPARSRVDVLDSATGVVGEPLEIPNSSPGPVAVADIDSDGDLDVFVGGTHVPGRFPEAAVSRVFLQRDGRLIPDGTVPAGLAGPGLVGGAVFSDLDSDGDPDLALACSWGPVRVFRNHKGRFTESTRELGLETLAGGWAGIAAGDFDEDGRPDLIASNLGGNTARAIPGPADWRLYARDFDGDGTLEIIDAFKTRDGDDFRPWRGLDVLGKRIPEWNRRFPTHRAFAAATVADLLADSKEASIHVDARVFEHSVFLNRGERFERIALPPVAQRAPGFGLGLGDFDGDGHLDVFLAQNSFDFDLDAGRADAGTGLCLLGDGRGGFRALSTDESGVALHGAQRAAAVADFDHDGRPDLVVTQSNGPTVLFRNTGGQAGLRVLLKGPAANPHGVGASLRSFVKGAPIGPAREVAGGTGYFSADSTTLVQPRLSGGGLIEVRWPGGSTTRHPVPPNATEFTVSP